MIENWHLFYCIITRLACQSTCVPWADMFRPYFRPEWSWHGGGRMDGRGHHPEKQVLSPLERCEPYSGSCLGRVMFEPRRMGQVPDLVSGSPVRLECGRKIERNLVWTGHGSDLVSCIQENKDIHADTILSAQVRTDTVCRLQVENSFQRFWLWV